jgi:hypothetical protein
MLSNAFTCSFKEAKVNRRYELTARLGRFITPVINPYYARKGIAPSEPLIGVKCDCLGAAGLWKGEDASA